MPAETNLITKADLARAREVQFALNFGYSVKKLMEALGTTRMIPKQAGTNLAYYKTKGTLDTGAVAEGETIPLSKYKTERVALKEINIRKWRKATSVEAILEKGYDQAVTETSAEMLKDVQRVIRKDFFEYLKEGTGTASGVGLQETIANAWGKLQVLFEDDEIESVYFMNPQDVADYLGKAPITIQNAFGMKYIKDFLGLGTVILNSSVTKGKIYATAKSNIVLYYVPVNGADIGEAFTFTPDETGLIGIHETPDYTNMTSSDTVISGLVLFAEKIDGIVVGTINETGA